MLVVLSGGALPLEGLVVAVGQEGQQQPDGSAVALTEGVDGGVGVGQVVQDGLVAWCPGATVLLQLGWYRLDLGWDVLGGGEARGALADLYRPVLPGPVVELAEQLLVEEAQEGRVPAGGAELGQQPGGCHAGSLPFDAFQLLDISDALPVVQDPGVRVEVGAAQQSVDHEPG